MSKTVEGVHVPEVVESALLAAMLNHACPSSVDTEHAIFGTVSEFIIELHCVDFKVQAYKRSSDDKWIVVGVTVEEN